MDIEVRKLLRPGDPSAIVRCSGDYIVVTTPGSTDTACRVELYTLLQNGAVSRVAEWQCPGASDLGEIVVVDSVNRAVYAAHRDSTNVTVLLPSAERQEISGAKKVIALPFDGKILDIVRFPGDASSTGDSFAVVSESGQVTVLKGTSSLCALCKTSLSFSAPVAAVSHYGKNALVFTLRNEDVLDIRVVLLNLSSEADVCSTTEKPAIRITLPKRKAKLWGCTMQPRSIFLLFSDGTLEAVHAKSYNASLHQGTLGAWWVASAPTARAADTSYNFSPASNFKLSSGIAHKGSARSKTKVKGSISALGDHYVAVAFGKHCSIWDAAFHADHGYTKLAQSISSVQTTSDVREVRLLNDTTVFSLRMNSISDKGLSLAEAMRRKGSCDAIWSGPGKASLLRAQPVTVNLMKTVSDAGGGFARTFDHQLKMNDGHDRAEIKRILSRMKTPTPADLLTAIHPYVKSSNGRLRRGKHGKASDLGLAKLPSTHLAASTCARCLYEVSEGNLGFVAPFIDMAGTGVVSNEAVMASLSDWGSKEDARAVSFTSISSILSKSHRTLYALEAAVVGVSDLPESDIVRCAQMATRSRRVVKHQIADLERQQEQEESGEKNKDLALRKRKMNAILRKAHRLLLRCVVARVDRAQLMDALRKIPQHDVRNMLLYLTDILEDFEPRRSDPFYTVKSKEQQALAKSANVLSWTDDMYLEYRGVGNWLDEVEIGSVEGIVGENQELQGCIEWASLILDTHLASIVLDEEGRSAVQSLLKSVTFQRQQSEAMAPMAGALEHILSDVPLPKHKPLYTVTTEEVRMYASFQ